MRARLIDEAVQHHASGRSTRPEQQTFLIVEAELARTCSETLTKGGHGTATCTQPQNTPARPTFIIAVVANSPCHQKAHCGQQ